MRIGIDYLPAVTHWPGVGRGVRELVRALVRLADAPRLDLIEWGGVPRRVPADALGLEQARVARHVSRLPRRVLRAFPGLASGSRELERSLDLLQRAHPDWPPLRARRQVWSAAELPAPGTAAAHAAADLGRSGAHALAYSDAAARRLVEAHAFAPERVHRVPVGVDHWTRAAARVARPDPVVLVLGAVRAARRPLAVLDAFERLRAGGLAARLVYAGRRGDAAEALEAALDRSPERGAVELHYDVEEARLPDLVAAAAVLVHLERETWTPVTPLEAAAFGAALLLDPLPPFREALGDAAYWTDPTAGGAALAERLAEALEDGLDPERREARARRFETYTWERAARATLDVWETLLGAGPR